MAKKNAVKTNYANEYSLKILKQALELSPEEMRWNCPVDIFNFKSTNELEPLNNIIGQPRATEALKLGAELWSKGYNTFVSGVSGTGRLTTVKSILEEVNTTCPITYDYCYVNNFTDPDTPRLIKLPRKKGKEFSQVMKDSIFFLRRRLPQLFEEESFQTSRRKISEEFQKKELELLTNFDEKIRPAGFVRGQLEGDQGLIQPEVFPMIEGKAVAIDELNELLAKKKITKKKADDLKQQYQQFHNELYDLSRAGMKLMQEYRKEMIDNDKSACSLVVESALKEVENKITDAKVKEYLKEVKDFILNNLVVFVPASGLPAVPTSTEESETMPDAEEAFTVFKVNVVLDNSDRTCAPIIIETAPNYNNLFGTIERVYDSRGFWKTDFSKIKAGSLLKADQGYLIVNALDLLNEPGTWQNLKRVLLYDKLEIIPFDTYFQISQTHLKPEAIDINVKVIMIGDQYLYNMLYEYEKDFKKMFKVLAQFDYDADLSTEMYINYARFIKKICDEEKLPHCAPSAVAKILEWAVELAGSRRKITLKFSSVSDILRESAFFARQSASQYITAEDVSQAIENRFYRNNLIDEKLRESIIDGMMLIDTHGERVGQINGLTVMSTGLLSFGKPARITVSVASGSNGVVNIEREAELSGSIHNKGVLIISGLLNELFAKKASLSLTASIAFEQSYGGIDGDSASTAEVVTILSALTEVPINQRFAITGSINQKGDIQPIGGLNEKIRGFFDICAQRGLDGSHGVVFPKSNIDDLMLHHSIVDAVREGKFHLYAIERLEEAVELMTCIPAGVKDENGDYPEGTIFYKAAQRLEEFKKSGEKTPVKKNKKKDKKANNEK